MTARAPAGRGGPAVPRGAALLIGLSPGDTVVLKKSHPCGANEWRVVRVGADIGLACSGCGRRMLLDRLELGRRVKEIRRSTVSVDSNTAR